MDNTVLINMNRLHDSELLQVHAALESAFARYDNRREQLASYRAECEEHMTGNRLAEEIARIERQNSVVAQDLRQVERPLDLVSTELTRRDLDARELQA